MDFYRELATAVLIVVFLLAAYWGLEATGGAAMDIPGKLR